MRRDLSEGELAILELIRVHYGSLNRPDQITFTDSGEAIIWVKKDDGSVSLVANLTNPAKWRAEGRIRTEEELLRDWLDVGKT